MTVQVSIDYFLGVAIGEMDMSVAEFWEMRLKNFFLKLFHYDRKRQEEREFHANLIRMQTIAIVNIQLASKDRIRDPRKFWLFPWESEEKQPSERKDISNAQRLGDLLL